MATLRTHARIDRNADDVWAVVKDSDAIADWFPGLDGVTVTETSRTLSMGGISIVEDIVTVDDGLRRFQYSITEAPMPVESHLGTMDVIEDGDGALLIYSTEIKPDDASALLGPIVEGAVASLKTHLEG